MSSRAYGSLTVHECMQAMTNMDTFSDTSYSAPFVLVYKNKPDVRPVTSGVRASALYDSPQSRSVLEMRLDFQDYLMTDYLHSKRALLMSRIRAPCEEENGGEEVNEQLSAQGEFLKVNNLNKTIPRPVYQNFVLDNGGYVTLSARNKACSNAMVKAKTSLDHTHSSAGAKPRATLTRGQNKPRSVSTPSTAQQKKPHTAPFTLKYTKR